MTTANIDTTNVSSTTDNTTSTPASAEVTPVASEVKYKFESKEAAIAAYLDSVEGRKAIESELAEQTSYMSDICESISAQFGNGPFFGFGDAPERGNIVVKRDELYFIRARNTGRPKGSKNRTPAPAPAAAVAAPVAEETPATAPVVASTEENNVVSDFEAQQTGSQAVEASTPVIDVMALAQTASDLANKANELMEVVRSHQAAQVQAQAESLEQGESDEGEDESQDNSAAAE